jgi:hypothetical protein
VAGKKASSLLRTGNDTEHDRIPLDLEDIYQQVKSSNNFIFKGIAVDFYFDMVLRCNLVEVSLQDHPLLALIAVNQLFWRCLH